MFAVVMTLCTYAACNGYFIDSATTKDDCMTNLVLHSDKLTLDVWNNDKLLTEYLAQFKIVEPVKMLKDYDFTCEFIPNHDIP